MKWKKMNQNTINLKILLIHNNKDKDKNWKSKKKLKKLLKNKVLNLTQKKIVFKIVIRNFENFLTLFYIEIKDNQFA